MMRNNMTTSMIALFILLMQNAAGFTTVGRRQSRNDHDVIRRFVIQEKTKKTTKTMAKTTTKKESSQGKGFFSSFPTTSNGEEKTTTLATNKESGFFSSFHPTTPSTNVEIITEEEFAIASSKDPSNPFPLIFGTVTVAAVAAASYALDMSIPELFQTISNAFQDPGTALDQVVQNVESMGPILGPLYFGAFYTFAEILAIPAIAPMTASAGFLFGIAKGTAIVLTSASIAASVAFFVGKTILRDYVDGVLEQYPKFRKIDLAVAKQGFKVMLLIRLSPVFPFAISNYLYGASSISFWQYFWGTLLGFTPGTVAYVYTGVVGKALISGDESTQPWYVYAGGLLVFAGLLKILADVASGIVDEIEDADE